MKVRFTETLARKAGNRPKTVIGIWALVVLLSMVLIGALFGDATTTDTSSRAKPESSRADQLLAERLGGESDSVEEMVVIRSSSMTVEDAAYRAYFQQVYTELAGLGQEVVLSATNYYESGDESLVSENRRSVLIPLTLVDDEKATVDQVYRVIDAENGRESFDVLISGEATAKWDSIGLAEEVLQKGESIGIMVALVILAIVFGALASALLPILIAVVAIIVALGATALFGQAFSFSFFVQNMITMMGLAVGIDYSLFILSRYREERERGLEKLEAITAAGGTASRSVMFSGMTVVLALVGLMIFPLNIFWSAGLGAMLVVIAAVMASLTLLPAVLSLFGDKVNKWRLPWIGRQNLGSADGNSGFWVRSTRLVVRKPVVSIIVAGGLLLAITAPYLDLNKGMAGISALPDDLRSKQGFTVLQNDFGWGTDAPAVIVVDGQTDSAQVESGTARLETILKEDTAFASSRVETHPEANLTIVYARLSGDVLSQQSMDGVMRLRSDYIPQAFGDSSDKVMVAGDTAEMVDFRSITDTYTPIVFAIVLGLSFILLTLAFRSIVISAKAVLMNLLSVGAAYGMLVLVFQKGVGASLFGFQTVDAIETWLPLFLFAVLFGLSMDYHVFLLSRIRERFIRTGDNAESVTFGLRSTGKLITGAAMIMVAVFGGFAAGGMAMFQQMGFGLAVAVLMDATIVRSVLVPATMSVLGRLNWYFPHWLEWLPDISISEASDETAAKESRTDDFIAEPVPVPAEVNREMEPAGDVSLRQSLLAYCPVESREGNR